jgi:hypothetical protein
MKTTSTIFRLSFADRFIRAFLITTLLICISIAVEGQVQQFHYVGGIQTYTAPATGEYRLELFGAQGGGIYGYTPIRGGYGGYASGNIMLEAGQTIYIFVGDRGVDRPGGATQPDCSYISGGWNGGGATLTGGNGAPGGGATDVRIGGISLGNRVIVAGGGGGSGWAYTQGGDGGGYNGFDGYGQFYAYNGRGGSPYSGGEASLAYNGYCNINIYVRSGSLGSGGMGVGSNLGGGGGGGGYYGGGGGSWGAGGGGSSYLRGVRNGFTYPGVRQGPGLAIITPIQTQTITTSTINNSNLCPGVSFNVPFTATGSFNTGNSFTAQLSDASGSFASPTPIGSISGMTSGSIQATAPLDIPAGTGYRVRVVSSNPSIIGSDNGENLSIDAQPTATLSGGGLSCAGASAELTVILTGTSPWTLTYTDGTTPISINNISASPYKIPVSPTSSKQYSLIAVSDASCTGMVSGSASVTVNDSPTAILNGGSNICPGVSTDLNVVLSGSAPWSLTYTDGTTPVTVDNITTSPYTIQVTPNKTTSYSLISISDASCSGTVSGDATVSIEDTVPPIAVAQPVTLKLSEGGTLAPATVNNGSSDNCTPANALVLSLDKTIFTCEDTGDQMVILTVEDAAGQTHTTTATVTVVNDIAPATSFSVAPVCEGVATSFADVSTGVAATATYAWDVDNNGTTDYNTKIVSHTYAAAGLYTAKLTITQHGCSYSTTQQVEVKAIPDAPIATSNDNVMYGSTLRLQASTIEGAIYSWTGPNDFTSSDQNPEISNVTFANAGDYYVTATINGCTGSAGIVTVTVNKAISSLNLTATDLNQSYNGSSRTVGYTIHPVDLDGVTVTYTGTNGITYPSSTTPPVNAGSYIVEATLSNENYMATPITGTLIVDKAIATISFENISHTYDGTVKGATALTSPEDLSGMSISYRQGSTPVVSPMDAGSYIVEATLTNDNYKLASSPSTTTMVIDKAIASITLENLSHTYNGMPKAATYITSPQSLAGVSLSYSQNATAVESPTNAGSYTVSATLINDNFQLPNPVNGTLEIDKAIATIDLSNLSHTYDGTGKEAIATTSPEGLSGLSIFYRQGSVPVEVPIDAGSYSVEAALDNQNYSLVSDSNPTGSKLHIAQAIPVLELQVSNVTYDGLAHGAGTSTVTGVGNAALTGTLTYEGISPTAYVASSTAPTAAGNYVVKLSYAGSTNYEAKVEEKSYSIAKAVLTVTNDDHSKFYGTTLNVADLNGSITGLVSGDGITVSRSSAGAPATASVAAYPILGELSDPDNKLDNYEVSNSPGTLTVRQVTPTVVATGGVFTYNGQAHTGSGAVTGLLSPAEELTPVTLSYEKLSGDTYSAIPGIPMDAGTYKVIATYGGNTNYTSAIHTASMTINQAVLTVTTNSRSKTYGQVLTSADFSGSVSGNVSSDNIIIEGYNSTGSAGAATVAGGPYEIAATLSDPNNRLANYARQNSYSSLTVNQATLTIKADDDSRAYGDPNPVFNGSVTNGAQNGETFTVTGASPTALSTSPSGSTHAIIPAVSGNTLANYSIVKQNGTLTITNATLTIKADNASRQYSDLNPVFTGMVVSGVQNGETFTVTGATTATTSTAPDNYAIVPEVTGATLNNYTVVKQNGVLTVTREDALAIYTGATFASTSSIKASTATVTLAATILDITADNTDQKYDAYPGDIRKATVTFINRDNGQVLAADIPVGLVSSADLKVGTASTNVTLSLGGSDSESFTIGIIVNNYYARNSSDDNTVVTVSKPLNDFVTGGGYLVLERSAGEKSGDVGRKNNFGFNIKYNKKGTNLQGNINTIVRRKEADGVVHVYQIKGNVMNSLSVQPISSTTGKATFNGQASIQDITNPDLPISVEGGATLQVTMTDMEEPGKNDLIAITVWKKNGGLWFASDWDGTKTAEKLLTGGNVVVQGGAFSNLSTSATQTKIFAADPTANNFYNYPNHFSEKTTVSFFLDKTEQYVLEVFDMRGVLVKTIAKGTAEADKLYEFELRGEGMAEGVYITRLITPSKMQSLKIVLKK